MTVRVHGQGDGRVAELVHHHSRMDALSEQQRRAAVPEVREPQTVSTRMPSTDAAEGSCEKTDDGPTSGDRQDLSQIVDSANVDRHDVSRSLKGEDVASKPPVIAPAQR